jgi:hypothetical protein
MKYYKLNLNGTNWVQTKLNDINISYRWIKLYKDDCLTIKGIGMYKKISHFEFDENGDNIIV